MSPLAPDEFDGETITRAVGEELRRVREARGMSRCQLVGMLPSGIGERTLLSYEHGARQLTVLRLAELSWALGVDAPTVFGRGLQRAKLLVQSLTLAVDLHALLADERVTFRPLAQWAKNTLNDHPDGVVEVQPDVVQNLARFIGCTQQELTDHLVRFTPDIDSGDRRPAERT
ncbi:helix-turn-helix domain-containing protein [Actinophytocola sp.]|uniref:helix-turn-helix domain-containing protein n=1 Tax=Actinophytocola sp. TaxID=1872138 RepID=UPI00389AEA10